MIDRLISNCITQCQCARMSKFSAPSYLNFICREILDGILVFDENNNPIGKSKKASVKGITQVVISRITMAAPGMSEFHLCYLQSM